MAIAYWSFALICIHAGFNLVDPFKRLYAKRKRVCISIVVIMICISIRGIFSFIKKGFSGYMTGKTQFAFFDYDEMVIFFLMGYIAVMILFMMVGFGCFR